MAVLDIKNHRLISKSLTAIIISYNYRGMHNRNDKQIDFTFASFTQDGNPISVFSGRVLCNAVNTSEFSFYFSKTGHTDFNILASITAQEYVSRPFLYEIPDTVLHLCIFLVESIHRSRESCNNSMISNRSPLHQVQHRSRQSSPHGRP